MGNCYIFNTAGGTLQVTLNGVDLGPLRAAGSAQNYAPHSLITPIAYHNDSPGVLAIGCTNRLSLYYQDDPQEQFGPYAVDLCFAKFHVSVDDDVVIYAGRALVGNLANVLTMTKRGFILHTKCPP